MSQITNSSIGPSQATQNNEDYYDLHPSPWDIEYTEIRNDIIAYIDPNNCETFLIELRYADWKSALKAEKLWKYMLRKTDVDVYRNRKLLFLRRLLF